MDRYKLFKVRVLLFLLLPYSVLAQFNYNIDQSIPVEVNGKNLLNPWAGGLNAAQVNTMDLNADGKADLIVFDKTVSRISTFLAVDNGYHYAPDYETLFPVEVNTFVVLRDYNCDGKKDLFTFGQIGVLVFQNVTQPGKPLAWKKLAFYNSTTGLKSEVLLTLGFSGKINLLPGSNDLPNFTDMDGDGDLDVLNMRFVSPSTAEYHKNFSMERYGRCDSLDLERQTQNWGGFEECSCGKIAFGKTCIQLGGRAQHTGGKALLTLDLDGDGDKDLLFSEESCPRIYYLENQGNSTVAIMNSVSLFPATNPVGIQVFPAPYLEDVDFDGKTDLIASPNLGARVDLSTNFLESLWFYKNTGSNQLPIFTYLKNNLLQEDMIEVGDFSAPAFTDIDQDGDKDLFIGRYTNTLLSGAISYYENTGTASAPSFNMITNDFLGLSKRSIYNIKPQFIDADKNGGIDLVLTATSTQNGSTNLYYILSSSKNSTALGGQGLQLTNVTIGLNENITMADIDQDGKVDLLIGKSTGSLEYWRNTGTKFLLTNNKFLGLGESVARQNITAVVGDVDHDGRDDIVVGDQQGQLSVFGDFRSNGSNTQPIPVLIYNSLSKSHTARNLGGSLRPVITYLLGIDKPEIIVGNTLGGLYILKSDDGQALSDEPMITLFPNPLRPEQLLSILTDRNARMEIFTVHGQQIGTSLSITGNQVGTYPLQGVAPGIYVARFTYGDKTVGRRFIIL